MVASSASVTGEENNNVSGSYVLLAEGGTSAPPFLRVAGKNG